MNAAGLLASATAPPPGTPFGDYILIEEIGGGAMGRVFTAAQRGSGRIVALKMARDISPDAARRFRTEIEAVAALDHPGIVPIYEVGQHEGVPFFTMKFAEHGSLADRFPDFEGRCRDAAELVERIAGAVHHAHSLGILHRDLKPGNILLNAPGEPFVADFGLARWLGRDSDLTQSLAVLGTPDYLAPEMLRGAREGSTIAADIFSLGVIFYQLLTGCLPFPGTRLPR